MTQARRAIRWAIVALPLWFACSGRTERAPNTDATGNNDGGVANDSGSGVVDAGRPTDVPPGLDAQAPRIDARDYYCNVPEPGPCCCDPSQTVFRAPETEAGVTTCEYNISLGRMRFDPAFINLSARQRDGKELSLPHSNECAPGAAGWMYVSKDPPVVRLCSSTCDSLLSGEYEAIFVLQGCYAIACVP